MPFNAQDVGKLTATGVLTALCFVAYCRLHGLVDGVRVPIDVSLQWGMISGMPAAIVAWSVWRSRIWLARIFASSVFHAALVTAAFFTLIALGGSALRLFAGVSSNGLVSLDSYIRYVFELAPVAAALSLAVLVLARVTSPPGSGKNERDWQPIADAWLPLPEAAKLHLKAADVHMVRAAGNYCEIHARTRVHLVRATIQGLEEKLHALGFVRAHRSFLINIARICSINPECRSGRWKVQFDNGDSCFMTDTYREAVIARISGVDVPASRRD